MQYPHDQLAKQIGERALAPFGATVTQAEISPETQYADLKHEPDPARAAGRERLGLLGQFASLPCLIEVFSDTPSGDEFRACLGKHFAFWRQRTRKMRADHGEQEPDRKSSEVAVDPFLWVISAGAPTTLMTELNLEAASDWPVGVYLFGGNVLRVGIVVAGQLPRERFTLLVRLMAAGSRLASTIRELRMLPPDAHERAVAEQSLLRLQHTLGQQSSLSPREQEIKMALYTSFEEIRAEGSASALLTVLQGRGIAVPETARERILAEKDPARLTHWLERAGVVTSIEELIGNTR